MVQRTSGGWSGALIVGMNRLIDRSSQHGITDFKTALNLSRKSAAGVTTVEYCVQTRNTSDFGTLLVEGTQRAQSTSVQYAAWRYGKDYPDFTGGGKGVALSHTSSVPEIDFEYTDKRAGQTGLLTKMSQGIASRLRLSGELLASARNLDTSFLQIRPGIEWSVGRDWKWTLDYLQTIKSRFEDSFLVAPSNRSVRLEARYQKARRMLRMSLAHTSSMTKGDYVTLFASAKQELTSGGALEVWSNLGQLAIGKVNY